MMLFGGEASEATVGRRACSGQIGKEDAPIIQRKTISGSSKTTKVCAYAGYHNGFYVVCPQNYIEFGVIKWAIVVFVDNYLSGVRCQLVMNLSARSSKNTRGAGSNVTANACVFSAVCPIWTERMDGVNHAHVFFATSIKKRAKIRQHLISHVRVYGSPGQNEVIYHIDTKHSGRTNIDFINKLRHGKLYSFQIFLFPCFSRK